MGKTALVVDDSTSMRQMVSFTLKEAGFTVLEGVNGKEALGKLEGQAKLDLIMAGKTPVVEEGMVELMAQVLTGTSRLLCGFALTLSLKPPSSVLHE